MGKKRNLLERAEHYVDTHMKVYVGSNRDWDKGGIIGIWQDSNGSVRISYENGEWFSYREENGLVFWD